MKQGKLQVIVGGQYGSEGKGAIAGYLAAKERDLLAIRTGGPNAGHTVVQDGDTWKLRSIPAAAVTNQAALLGISAGSEIDPAVLQAEGSLLDKNISGRLWNRLLIDRQATVILPIHPHQEREAELVDRIGSTGKGIGAARAARIMREAETWAQYMGRQTLVESALPMWSTGADVTKEARATLSRGGTVQIEAAQGYGLGLHAGFYPYCTSGDCRAIDALAAVGLSPWDPTVGELEVWVVFRVFPIRVAGNSGPMYQETSWPDLGLPEEFTTVTGKVRRVGMWDQTLADAAIEANGQKVRVALTMFDQLQQDAARVTRYEDLSDAARSRLDHFQNRLKWKTELVGTGPSTLIDLQVGG
jgi:adenylosuccinate synthase